MSTLLDGHVIIITGSGRGIGRAVAKGLATAGARVVVVARSEDEVTAVADEIRADGGEALAIVADVARQADVVRLVAETIGRWDRIDTLFNNAGTPGPQGSIEALDPAAVEQTWRVNVMGPFLCCQAVVPHMIARGGGNIINVSSGAGQRRSRAAIRSLPYQMSKFGLEGLTNGLATQLRDHKINVNSLLPGPIATRFHVESEAEWLALLAERSGRPEDVVAAARFLASRVPGTFTDQVVHARDVSADLIWLPPVEATPGLGKG